MLHQAFIVIFFVHFKVPIMRKLVSAMDSSERKELKRIINGEINLFQHFAKANPNPSLTTERFFRAHQEVYPHISVNLKRFK